MIQRIQRAPTGHRVGESHHRAKASDQDVARARELHNNGLSYGDIAKQLQRSRYTIRNWCTYQTRYV